MLQLAVLIYKQPAGHEQNINKGDDGSYNAHERSCKCAWKSAASLETGPMAVRPTDWSIADVVAGTTRSKKQSSRVPGMRQGPIGDAARTPLIRTRPPGGNDGPDWPHLPPPPPLANPSGQPYATRKANPAWPVCHLLATFTFFGAPHDRIFALDLIAASSINRSYPCL